MCVGMTSIINREIDPNTPHFHAYYQEHVAVYGIEPVEMLVGSLPKRQQRLVGHGLNCINQNWLPIGTDCKQVTRRCQSHRSRREAL
jgi:hypothetical protein